MGRGPAPAVTALGLAVSEIVEAEKDLRGLSGRALGIAAGISRERIRYLLSGRAAWTISELEDVCEVLELRVSTVVAQAERAVAAQSARLRPAPPAAAVEPVEVVDDDALDYAAYSSDDEPGQDWDSRYDSA